MSSVILNCDMPQHVIFNVKKHLLFIVTDECLLFLTATNKNLLFLTVTCDSMTYREETIVFNATNKCLLFTDKTGFKENEYNSLYMLFTRYIINIFTKQTIY